MAHQESSESLTSSQDVASTNSNSHSPNTTTRLKLAAPPVSMSSTVTATTSSPASTSPASASGKVPFFKPNLLRSDTTAAAVQSSTTTETTPLLSRPLTARAATSTSTPQRPTLARSATTSAAPTRPSLLRRATDFLDLVAEKASSYRNPPPTPTFWNDYPHRKALVKIWDAVHEVAASRTKYPPSLTAQLVATEKRILAEYGELAGGATPLNREWIEFVLGVCMRPPFCTAARMGRFEILATSAGARGNWGPW